MTYEIKDNLALYHLFRNRPGPLLRHRSRSVVWPRRLADVPAIPFKPYTAIMCDTFRDADAANKRAEEFINELNGQRGLGNLVQPPVMPTRGHWGQINIDGKRKAAGRSSNDVRDVDRREARQTATARWEACKCEECPDRDDGPGCMGRQRAGMCPAQSGSDMRSDASRDAGAGRTGRDQGGASEG